MKKDICRIGYSCGYSCINRSYLCEINSFPNGKVQSTLDEQASLRTNLTKPKRVKSELVDRGEVFYREAFSKLTKKEQGLLRDVEEVGKLVRDFSYDMEIIKYVAQERGDKEAKAAYEKNLDSWISSKKKYEKLVEVAKPATEKLYKRIITDLKKQSGVNKTEARKMVKRVLNGSFRKDEIDPWLIDLFQIVGNKASNLKYVEDIKDRRSQADISMKTMLVGTEFTQRSLYHEVGHFVERNLGVGPQSQDFIKQRATGDITKLSTLTGNDDYKLEIAYPDTFIHPYVGKVYYSNDTEVVSMGLQHFTEPKELFNLKAIDSDHLYFTLGVLLEK